MCKEKLKRVAKGVESSDEISLRTIPLTKSGPQALPFLRIRRASATSKGVTCISEMLGEFVFVTEFGS